MNRKRKDNHKYDCPCSLDNVPHADCCANCECGLVALIRKRNEKRKQARKCDKEKA